MSTNKYTGYFPHDSNAKDDPKIMIMMAQLGLEAYGIYWLLIEFLRDQDGYKAPLILLDALARRYGSSKEKFEAVVTKFNLFEYDDVNFYSPSLHRRMFPLDEKRGKMRENSLKRWGDNTINEAHNTKAMQLHSKSNAEKSREEYSIEEKSINISFDTFWNLYDKKVGEKTKLEKKWRALKDTDRSAIIDYIPAYKESQPDKTYRKNPEVFLNNKSWLDEIIKKSSNKHGIIPGEDPVDKMIREATEIMNRNKQSQPDGI